MAKTRATNHTGRQGQGTCKHNFREFPEQTKEKGNSEINRNLSYQNKFFLNNRFFESEYDIKKYLNQQTDFFKKQALRFSKNIEYKDLTTSQKYELLYFEKLLGEGIKAQHNRNAIHRQECLNRDALDIMLSTKTAPEESILQVGSKDHCPVSANQLWEIYRDYVKMHNTKFGRHIVILDAVMHTDETTPHIHERKAYVGQNKHGEACISKNSALGLLGINRPNLDKPQSRYNNPKQTYSALCRDMWIICCKQHGLDIETVPQVYKDKHGLDLTEYKVQQEQNKLNAILGQTADANKKLQGIKESVESKCSVLDFVQKQTTETIQKKDKLQKESDKLQKEITDSQSKKFWIGQEIAEQEQTIAKNAKIIEKQKNKILVFKDNWQDTDIAMFVAATVCDEYNDYYNEILADYWQEQSEQELKSSDAVELEL